MKTILIAEDNDSNFILMSYLLKKHYNIIRAKNGKEAVDYAAKGGMEIILMDIKMPEMDGFQLLQILQGDERLAKIPVVMLTGDEEAETKEQGRQAGIKAMLHKPFDISHLLNTITKYMD